MEWGEKVELIDYIFVKDRYLIEKILHNIYHNYLCKDLIVTNFSHNFEYYIFNDEIINNVVKTLKSLNMNNNEFINKSIILQTNIPINIKRDILTPKEYFKMREQLNPVYKVMCDVLLFTGMKIGEFWEFINCPEWYDAQRRCINISPKKRNRHYIPRTISLNENGCNAVQTILTLNLKQISRVAMNEAITRAAIKCGIEKNGIYPKMFRKMLVSWLFAAYPNKQLEICILYGGKVDILIKNYLGIGFAQEDVEDMRKFLKGWNE